MPIGPKIHTRKHFSVIITLMRIDKEKDAAYKRAWRLKNIERLSLRAKEYYIKNREILLLKASSYRKNNREKFLSAMKKSYRKRDKKELWAIYRHRYATNIQHRLSSLLRSRLGKVISRKQKVGSSIKDLGCTLSELQNHLELQFKFGMSWDNHGLWHIDHIKPLSAFNLEDRKQFLEACNYKNLQPLWAKDNLQKRNKMIY